MRGRRLQGIIVASLLSVGASLAGYFLLWSGRPATGRSDLRHLPADAPPPVRGYPTTNAMYLAYGLGRIKLLDPKAPVPIPSTVNVELNQDYMAPPDDRRRVDVYYPALAPDKPAPVLLFIHGGGWSKGGREDYKVYTVAFAEKGYVAATTSYRLSGAAKFPAPAEDIKCAVRWLRANAARFGGDPDTIILVGGSAGAHLALLAAYSDDADFAGECDLNVSARVQGVVDLYGPVDLRTPIARDAPEVLGLMGVPFEDAAERFAVASPIEYLDVSDPPTLIIHGTLDETVPISESDTLAERLQELGSTYWYDRVDGYPHTMDVVPEINARVQWMIDAFIQRQVLRGTSP